MSQKVLGGKWCDDDDDDENELINTPSMNKRFKIPDAISLLKVMLIEHIINLSIRKSCSA